MHRFKKKKRGGPRYSEQLEDLASTILYPVEQFIENANYYTQLLPIPIILLRQVALPDLFSQNGEKLGLNLH